MNITTALRRTASAMLLSGVAAAAALGLAAGTASATNGAGEGAIDSWSNFEWCPGDPIMQKDNEVNWDWNVCHFWHYQSPRDGAPTLYWVAEGIRPAPCQHMGFLCPPAGPRP